MSDTLAQALESAVCKVSADWKKAKRQADREDRVSRRDLERLRSWRSPRTTIRQAAFRVMRQAYMMASSDGRYYANARQIMYAARPLVMELTGGEYWKNSAYFTQTLLKDYLDEYSPSWRVVWDSRGHLTEPHTKKVIGIGGAEVERYLTEWTNGDFEVFPWLKSIQQIKTVGPHLRFNAALFIEKEGFNEILEHAGLGDKYDLAIMSTKGLPVGAACQLASRFNQLGVQVLVMHDFDLAGFKIVKTLRQGTRLAPGARVIDLGFRLADVTGLQVEPVEYQQKRDPRRYLRDCGATDAERDFLVHSGDYRGWAGERVELNAMTSEQLIGWLERKLEEHGVDKVVPGPDTLARAYRRAVFLQAGDREMERLRDEFAKHIVEVPKDLEQRVRVLLEEGSASWDAAVWQMVEHDEAWAEDDPTVETGPPPAWADWRRTLYGNGDLTMCPQPAII